MLSGGDVRPLALVVIGRGQITTPYILVIPSEGDYCFIGRIFSTLCYIFFHHSTTINTTQTLLFQLSPALPSFSSPFVSWLCFYSFCLFYLYFLLIAILLHLFACLLRFECSWLCLNLSVLHPHTHTHTHTILLLCTELQQCSVSWTLSSTDLGCHFPQNTTHNLQLIAHHATLIHPILNIPMVQLYATHSDLAKHFGLLSMGGHWPNHVVSSVMLHYIWITFERKYINELQWITVCHQYCKCEVLLGILGPHDEETCYSLELFHSLVFFLVRPSSLKSSPQSTFTQELNIVYFCFAMQKCDNRIWVSFSDIIIKMLSSTMETQQGISQQQQAYW